MFVSTSYLAINYGVDDKIAKFFVDREPPENNLYWKDKLMYLRFAPGYLFIPLIVDILYKLGIDRNELLGPKFIDLMEGIGHATALEETKQISVEDAVEQCIQLASAAAVDEQLLKLIIDYFNDTPAHPFNQFHTGFKALHRGDLFLFALPALHIPPQLYHVVVQHWFALISSLLLLDDADDVQADKMNNEENAFLEAGLNIEGVLKLKQLVKANFALLSTINKPLVSFIDKQVLNVFNRNHFQELINQ